GVLGETHQRINAAVMRKTEAGTAAGAGEVHPDLIKEISQRGNFKWQLGGALQLDRGDMVGGVAPERDWAPLNSIEMHVGSQPRRQGVARDAAACAVGAKSNLPGNRVAVRKR